MQFREANISSYSEALGHLVTFATDLGFVVTTGTGSVGVRAQTTDGAGAGHPRPSPVSMFYFEVLGASTPNGYAGAFSLALSDSDSASAYLRQTLDVFNVRAQDGVTQPAPSKVSMFGFHPTGTWTPTQKNPWIALVFTYEFNYYRHVYAGYMNRAGAYTGGEIMSIANGPRFLETPTNIDDGFTRLRSSSYSHHFGALNKRSTGSHPNPSLIGNGGVRIIHPNNPYPIRRFSAWNVVQNDNNNYPIGPPEAFNGVTPAWAAFAMGGLGDGPNDPLMEMAHGEVSNAQIMVPINLYMTEASGRYVPLGSPPGIRYVNMRDLAPEQSVAIGSEAWRAFPEICRSDASVGWASRYTGDGLGVRRRQTSQYIGYAYPENPT